MAAAFAIPRIASAAASPRIATAETREQLEFAGVFRGRELTRKDRRSPSGLPLVDNLLDGGIVRGRVSEIIGDPSSGKTTLAASFAAFSTMGGEVAAWIDSTDSFDPESMAAAGVDLTRLLWVSSHRRSTPPRASAPYYDETGICKTGATPVNILKAAEWILAAGGFGLVVIDFSGWTRAIPESAALRLARATERSGAAVIVLAAQRICGTFAALSLVMNRNRTCFNRSTAGAPVLFDGLVVKAMVTRNKLGGSGGAAMWKALADPLTDSDAENHRLAIFSLDIRAISTPSRASSP
jgi:recA bacterial DNA recombination protein